MPRQKTLLNLIKLSTAERAEFNRKTELNAMYIWNDFIQPHNPQT